ncbi:MAG: hypothetical protein Q7R64_01360, partial [bacterium]|nr:hypothetical protein [bacterium]
MAKFELRKQARMLRFKGISIRTIAKKLDVSKSTASIWCNDIELTVEQKKHLLENALESGLKGRFSGAEANKKKKVESLRLCKEWSQEILHDVNQRDLFIAGIALYWAEGTKKGAKAFNFVNSDPV